MKYDDLTLAKRRMIERYELKLHRLPEHLRNEKRSSYVTAINDTLDMLESLKAGEPVSALIPAV